MPPPNHRQARPWRILSQLLAGLIFIGSLAGIGGCQKNEPTLHLAAAASLEPVLRQLTPQIERQLHCRLMIDVAASGILSRQILQGSPADLFISANARWMDELARQGRLLPGTRIDLLGNRLVVVARPELPDPPRNLQQLRQPRLWPIALGDPAYVPAGQYAKAALQSARLWPTLQDQSTAAPNVQAALAYVLQGQCPVGLVYASDVTGVPEARILFEVPQALYPPIVYPAAVIRDAAAARQARAVVDWLQRPEAQAAFRKAGFLPPPAPSDGGSKPATRP